MEQDLNKIEYTYDKIAKTYAEAFSNEHEKKPKDQEILHQFSKKIGDRVPVWDFGCGPGQTANFLKNLGIKISGLDLSEKMIKQAKILYPDIHFQKGNILDLEFKNDSIAGIVAFYAIVHFTKEQVDKTLHEIYRVLQPDGLFLFTFHIGDETLHIEESLGKKIDIDFMFYTTDFISNCLKNAGFKNIEIIERNPYHDVEYESRRAYIFTQKPRNN